MRKLLTFLSLIFLMACSNQPINKDLFYTEYENNSEYSTKKMGDYFVVLTFTPKTIYNNYIEEENKFIWKIGDNEIKIENDALTINKIKFGSVIDNRIIKVDRGRVFVDDEYRSALKK